jgi:acetyltransferase-like isoleucine patch superfamily enzyme
VPNKVIGAALAGVQRAFRTGRQYIADSVNYSQLSRLEVPFDIHYSVEFRSPQQVRIDQACCIKARTIVNGRSKIKAHGVTLGPDTYIKEACYLDAYGGYIEVAGQCAFAQGTVIHGGGGVVIGTNVIIGACCSIIASNHRFDSNEFPIMLQGDKRRGIKIGNNVWLGGHVVVLDGVVIGDNCVIGAGTVVTKNVASNTVILDARTRREEILYVEN